MLCINIWKAKSFSAGEDRLGDHIWLEPGEVRERPPQGCMLLVRLTERCRSILGKLDLRREEDRLGASLHEYC